MSYYYFNIKVFSVDYPKYKNTMQGEGFEPSKSYNTGS